MKPLLIDLNYTLTDSYIIKEIDTDYFKNIHHFHKDYELVVVLESSGKRVIGDHIENFDEGDVIFLGPNLPHAWFNDKDYYERDSILKAKSIVIYFKKPWLENVLLKLPETSKLEKCFEKSTRGIKLKGKSRELISQIASEIQQSEGLKRTIDLLNILNEIAETKDYQLLASTNYLNSYNENEEQRIQQVYEYVIRRFPYQIKLEEVAAIANMSPNAFCRYFKTRTQKNFSLFVNEIRINHACKLLRKKDLSISYICYESGFQSMTNFNKFFKKIMNKSPLEFRKEISMVKND